MSPEAYGVWRRRYCRRVWLLLLRVLHPGGQRGVRGTRRARHCLLLRGRYARRPDAPDLRPVGRARALGVHPLLLVVRSAAEAHPGARTDPKLDQFAWAEGLRTDAAPAGAAVAGSVPGGRLDEVRLPLRRSACSTRHAGCMRAPPSLASWRAPAPVERLDERSWSSRRSRSSRELRLLPGCDQTLGRRARRCHASVSAWHRPRELTAPCCGVGDLQAIDEPPTAARTP